MVSAPKPELALGDDLLVQPRRESRDGEVIEVGYALEGPALEGGEDARVELVERCGQVEGRQDARKGLRHGLLAAASCGRQQPVEQSGM